MPTGADEVARTIIMLIVRFLDEPTLTDQKCLDERNLFVLEQVEVEILFPAHGADVDVENRGLGVFVFLYFSI
jgi:hypothetical protein